MADLHRAFCVFHNRIALTAGRKFTLQSVRDSLREHIRNYFRNMLRVEAPTFHGQGSFALNTVVNPIDEVYGIDDGVYLQHLDEPDDAHWPTAAAVHQWLINATGGHTIEKPMGKRTCVRVRYPGPYYVDLRTYGELNEKYLMAVKGEPRWLCSDPLAFNCWFGSYVHQRGEQLRRMVRYLKAWADYQSARHGKMAGGMILTVLAAHYFHGHEREDRAVTHTVDAISDAVRTELFVLNPVDISEELTGCLTDPQKKRFKDAVQAFADIANGALVIEDGYKASKLWRKLLGDRFPLGPVK